MSLRSKFLLLKNYGSILIDDLNKKLTNQPFISNKKVVFDLKDIRLSAYYFHVIHAFHLAGYQILIKHNLLFLANCLKADRFIFHFNSVRIGYLLSSYIVDEWIYIYDRFVNPNRFRWKKKILISCDVYSSKPIDKDWIQIPFSMAPHNYLSRKFESVYNLRGNTRTIKLFFSGNLDEKSYRRPIFQDFFKILDRVDVINTVKASLCSDELLDHLPSKDSKRGKAVLLSWSWNKDVNKHLEKRIENEKWLEVLSTCDFFLATPGLMMPMCFNIIEAMSVGAIPIIEFPELFCPALRHNETAIVFHGKSDLTTKIRTIMEMDIRDIIRIRKNVVGYYDNHLYPTIITEMVESNIGTKGMMFLHATKSSYDDHLQIKSGALTVTI